MPCGAVAERAAGCKCWGSAGNVAELKVFFELKGFEGGLGIGPGGRIVGVEDEAGALGGEGGSLGEIEEFEDVEVMEAMALEGGGEMVEIEAVDGVFKERGEEAIGGLVAMGGEPEGSGLEAADLADGL